MPRFTKEETWNLLTDISPRMFPLVKEALSLRQKVVTLRQSIKYLQRCRTSDAVPKFISNKKLGALCGLEENDLKMKKIYRTILTVIIKEKQHALYSFLLKCTRKEDACRRLVPARTWRRIENGSRSICASIRSEAKSRLRAKYDKLRSATLKNPGNVESSLPSIHRFIEPSTQNESTTISAKVTVIGDTPISDDALGFLSLGPSFSITQKVDGSVFRKVVGGLHRLRDQLRVRTRLNDNSQNPQNAQNPQLRRTIPPIPFPSLFYKEPQPSAEADVKFKILSAGVLDAYTHQAKHPRPINLTYSQRLGYKEIRDLVSSNAIRISVSDKGGEFVILPRILDRKVTELHLSDTTIYRRVTEKEFQAQYKRLNHVWVKVGRAAGLSESFLGRLKLETPECPVFYSLVKTHKLAATDDARNMTAEQLKIRPIISCVGGPTDRISWFLNKIVNQLLDKVPSHLTNTNHFLERLRNTTLQSQCVAESFDVVSLYTNVQNDDALQAVSEMLNSFGEKIQTFGLSKTSVMLLIKECLSCNIFRWSGTYYTQLRGLAMGQRLAPVLAICFMSRIEEPVLSRMPLMYCRYIDDCCIITSTQSEMDECFRLLNQQSQHIKFTRQQPRNGWLPYLNVQIRLFNGAASVKWYRKESSKNILVNARSAHPIAVKRAVIRNMLKTATNVCAGEEERKDSQRRALEIARMNGYALQKGRSGPSISIHSNQHQQKIPLCLPFVSDETSAAVRRCIDRANLKNDVILVDIPSDNIRKRLVRNRLYDNYCRIQDCVVCPSGKVGDCGKTGVIYEIECIECSATYIGETGRPLWIRMKEHLASKRRGSLTTPLGRHKVEFHCGKDFEIRCTILAYEYDTASRKALEAFWIFARNPCMNNRNECASITNDFMPFMALCELKNATD